MKRICIALCLSLFASLIHAAAMPIDLSAYQPQHQITAIDNSVHHCDEVASSAQDKNSNQSCHGDGYHCCLGLVISSVPGIDLATDFTGIHISLYSSLVLQPMIGFIYKPPKAWANFVIPVSLICDIWSRLYFGETNEHDSLHGVVGC